MYASFLSALREYSDSGITKSYEFRIKQLKLFKQTIIKKEKEIEEALYADLKKNPEEVWATETGLLLQETNFTIQNLHAWMKPEKVRTNLVNLPSGSYIYPSPKGVVLIIGAWNFPLMLTLVPLVGAMAAGNCIVVKPSEHAPATATLIQKLLEEIFPPEYIYPINGNGSELIPPMMEAFRFDHIFFTGGAEVGKQIYLAAARQLTPVTLELGGKSPCIIENDANLEVTARRITVGKFANTGQLCVAPDYLLVHEDVKEKLITLIKKNIQKFYGPDPSKDYNYGKIINEKQFERITGYLKEGRVIAGGKYDKAALFIEPTLMDNISPGSSIMKEEIFGPLLPVLTFRTREEALKIIRQNPPPLSFYLFTGNKKKEKAWIEELQFGNGCINNTAWQFTNHHLPFGGAGASGIGGYHGKHTFDVFTHYKGIMKTPTWFDPAIKYPPLRGKLKLFKWIIR